MRIRMRPAIIIALLCVAVSVKAAERKFQYLQPKSLYATHLLPLLSVGSDEYKAEIDQLLVFQTARIRPDGTVSGGRKTWAVGLRRRHARLVHRGESAEIESAAPSGHKRLQILWEHCQVTISGESALTGRIAASSRWVSGKRNTPIPAGTPRGEPSWRSSLPRWSRPAPTSYSSGAGKSVDLPVSISVSSDGLLSLCPRVTETGNSGFQ